MFISKWLRARLIESSRQVQMLSPERVSDMASWLLNLLLMMAALITCCCKHKFMLSPQTVNQRAGLGSCWSLPTCPLSSAPGPSLAPQRLLSTGDLQSPPGPLSPGRAVWILELLCLCQGHERWNTVPSRGEKLHLLGNGWGYWEANRTTHAFPVPSKDHAMQEQVAKPRIIQPTCLCRTDLMCLIICGLTSDTTWGWAEDAHFSSRKNY